MKNDLRWLPTKEASAFLGVSSQFLKKNRDIKDGFLLEEKHYILGANINSSILWNVIQYQKEKIGLLLTGNQLFAPDVKKKKLEKLF